MIPQITEADPRQSDKQGQACDGKDGGVPSSSRPGTRKAHMGVRTPVVAYIAGLGHSGSTLLDLMIGAHSSAFSMGEIKSLKRFATLAKSRPKHEYHANRLGNRCACGAETIWQCAFWSKVNERLLVEAGLTLADLDINASDMEVFQSHNGLLFRAVSKVSGASVIVDSSKDPDRLSCLMATPGMDVRPIHLVRDPCGQINSAFRSYPPLRLLRAARSYNAVTIKVRRALKSAPYTVVHYEALIRDPTAILIPTMRALDLEFEAGQLDWARPVHHNLAGNGKVLLAQESTLRADKEWRQSFGILRRLEINLLTAPARLLNFMQRTSLNQRALE